LPDLFRPVELNAPLLFPLAACCASLPSRVEAMPCIDDHDSHKPKLDDELMYPWSFLLDPCPVFATDPAFAVENGAREGCASGIGDTPREGKGDLAFD